MKPVNINFDYLIDKSVLTEADPVMAPAAAPGAVPPVLDPPAPATYPGTDREPPKSTMDPVASLIHSLNNNVISDEELLDMLQGKDLVSKWKTTKEEEEYQKHKWDQVVVHMRKVAPYAKAIQQHPQLPTPSPRSQSVPRQIDNGP